MEECAAVLAKLKPAFIHHPECKVLLPEIIRSIGGDAEQVHFDVPRLRSAYPTNYLTSGIAYAFHPHRDTWYSAPFCQINWWMPIWEIEERNCLAFHPRLLRQSGREQLRDLQLLRMERQEPGQRGAARQVRHARAAEADPADRAARPPHPGAAGRADPVLGGAPARDGAEHQRRRALQHRLPHRPQGRRGGAARRGEPRFALHRHHHARLPARLRPARLPDDIVSLYDDGTAVQQPILTFGDRLVAQSG